MALSLWTLFQRRTIFFIDWNNFFKRLTSRLDHLVIRFKASRWFLWSNQPIILKWTSNPSRRSRKSLTKIKPSQWTLASTVIASACQLMHTRLSANSGRACFLSGNSWHAFINFDKYQMLAASHSTPDSGFDPLFSTAEELVERVLIFSRLVLKYWKNTTKRDPYYRYRLIENSVWTPVLSCQTNSVMESKLLRQIPLCGHTKITNVFSKKYVIHNIHSITDAKLEVFFRTLYIHKLLKLYCFSSLSIIFLFPIHLALLWVFSLKSIRFMA